MPALSNGEIFNSIEIRSRPINISSPGMSSTKPAAIKTAPTSANMTSSGLNRCVPQSLTQNRE